MCLMDILGAVRRTVRPGASKSQRSRRKRSTTGTSPRCSATPRVYNSLSACRGGISHGSLSCRSSGSSKSVRFDMDHVEVKAFEIMPGATLRPVSSAYSKQAATPWADWRSAAAAMLSVFDLSAPLPVEVRKAVAPAFVIVPPTSPRRKRMRI
mmetsp:Transcript_20965/g.60543  ORF Transcript_20965/g.60543 Transcript_20965/m.60543 type:complete len:153 (-) Transcript_20965:463-921(-)